MPAEKEKDFPEPVMFGEMPAYGFFIRHVKGLEMNNAELSYTKEDLRPAFVLDDVKGGVFPDQGAQHATDVPPFTFLNLENFNLQQSASLPDTRRERIKQGKL